MDSELFEIVKYGSQTDLARVTAYIAGGGNVNAKNKDGETPLFAVNDVDVAKLLISRGADVNVKSYSGDSVLRCWLKLQRWDGLIKLLIDSGARVEPDSIALTASTDIIELFLAKGADINGHDGHHGTALHNACGCLATGAIDLLLSKGADINATDRSGETPLDRVGDSADVQQYNDDLDELEDAKQKVRDLLFSKGAKRGRDLG